MYHLRSEDGKTVSFKDYNRPLGLVRKIKDGSMNLKKANRTKNNLDQIFVKYQEK